MLGWTPPTAGIRTVPPPGLKSASLDTHTQTLTFADEALLGDGLLAYITTLGLLEWLQLEGVCVDALQLVGLWEEEEERDILVGPQPVETLLVFSRYVAARGGLASAAGFG